MGKFAELFESTITEGMRLLKTHTSADGKKQAKVYRDAEWEEYRVKHYTDGKHHTEADYHTDDKEEAHHHANRHVNESVYLTLEALVPHSKIPSKDGSHVQMRNEHISKVRKLKDGEKHSESGGMYANHNGKSHFVKAHRSGDEVHLHDHKTGEHVASVNHKDMYHHMKESEDHNDDYDSGHIEMRSSSKTHVTIHKDDAKNLKGMSHGEKRHAGAVIHSSDDRSPGKLHKADATRDGEHIHLHDHKTGQHIATIHHSHVE